MSDVLADGAPAADPAPATLTEPGGDAGTWSLTVPGVRTVLRLELRQRVRSSRWVVVLGVWTAVIGGLTALVYLALGRGFGDGDEVGRLLFGIIVFLVLSLGALVAPALSATSVNGDRNAGVLATMQTTLLTPAEIAVGKLLAAWLTAMAFLATASPFILVAYLQGGTPLGRLVMTLLLLSITLLVVCAIGLGWSAVAARSSSSAVLTYLSVAMLGVGLPLLFALSLAFVTTEETVLVNAPTGDGVSNACEQQPQTLDRAHTERTWWLLAASPYVIVADAGPRPGNGDGDDPLTAIRDGVRELRLGPEEVEDWCGDVYVDDPARRAERDALGSVWPYGLATNLVLAGVFLAVTVRRLRTPTRNLPRGTRVA